jgi:hypothetical protein
MQGMRGFGGGIEIAGLADPGQEVSLGVHLCIFAHPEDTSPLPGMVGIEPRGVATVSGNLIGDLPDGPMATSGHHRNPGMI